MKSLRKLLFGAFVGLLAASGAQAQTTTVRIASFVPEQSFGVSKVIKPWMEAVQAEVGDKVRLQGFWGGTLGKDPFKQFELVKNGVADVAWVLPGYTPGQFPEMQIFELPFVFKTALEAGVTGWRLHQKGMLSGLEDVHVITVFASEPSNLWMREPIQSLDDLKGKKIRSAGAVQARWLEAFGATPETMDSPVMNEMLNRGTLDGAIQGATGMKTYKSLQLVKQHHAVPVGVIPFLLVMNKNTWAKLPEDVKAAMMKHGGEASARRAGEAYEQAGKDIRVENDNAGAIKVVEPTPAQAAAYEAKTEPVNAWWAEKTPKGKAVLDETQAILKAIRSGT